MQNLSELELDTILSRARSIAKSLNVAVNIAVVDSGTNLLSFYRMNGAIMGSIDVALRKAKTAVLFPMPTENLGKLILEEGLASLELSNDGLILFAGGEPLIRNGVLLGGIGVSGATAEQDKQIATAAVEVFSASD